MFYPKCPKCGGKSETTEDDPTWTKARAPHISGHHPIMHTMTAAFGVAKAGYQVWRRFPGGGGKRCTICGHQFK